MYTIAALYHFTRFDDPAALKPALLDLCLACDVKGTLLLAGEGGLGALQSFIVITAVPVSLLVASTLICAPITIRQMMIQSKQENSSNLASATPCS